jgi:hypothetical protein
VKRWLGLVYSLLVAGTFVGVFCSTLARWSKLSKARRRKAVAPANAARRAQAAARPDA